MKKEKAAPHSRTTQNSDSNHNINRIKSATKLELVALHLLENDIMGASSLSGLSGLHDLNFRNSISDLRKRGIDIQNEWFQHAHSGGGVTYLKRYWISNRNEARKVAELVNQRRKRRDHPPLSQATIARLLSAFPIDRSSVTPAA